MKKIFQFVFSILLFLFILSSCTKKDGNAVSPENVQNITATPGYGSVLFKWTFPDDSSYLYVSVSYTDSTGKTVEQKYSRFTDSAVIGGLTNKAYDFTVKAVSNNGGVSAAKEITITPDDPIYLVVAPTLAIFPGIGAAKIKWQNTTGLTLGIKVTYTDSTGTEQIVSDSSSKQSDTLIISGLQNIQNDFSVVLSDASGAHGSTLSFNTTPLKEIKISKSGWSVTADSQEENGEPAPNGFATAAIDDDINTYWHTEWDLAQPGYPHWIAVDMHQDVVLSRIELTPRQGHTDGFTQFDIDGSEDGQNWVPYETNLPLKQENNTQSFPVASNPTVRYVRIYATQGVDYYAHLAELTIYGGGN